MAIETTVTCSFAVYDGFRSKVKKLTEENARLRDDLARAKLVAGGGELALQFQETIRHALPVVQLAISQLDPEHNRWPHRDLALLAHAVKHMPGATQIEIEWATDAMHFAVWAAEIDKARAAGVQGALAQIPRSSIGSGQYNSYVEQLLGAGNLPTIPQNPIDAAEE